MLSNHAETGKRPKEGFEKDCGRYPEALTTSGYPRYAPWTLVLLPWANGGICRIHCKVLSHVFASKLYGHVK